MSETPSKLVAALEAVLKDKVQDISVVNGQAVVVLSADQLEAACLLLRSEESLLFAELIDVCGVDYSQYGQDQWRTAETSASGFTRGVTETMKENSVWDKPRFAVVYHLLSLHFNWRVRLKVYLNEGESVCSVVPIWPSANWHERETYDLFGIVFEGHPDLRRLLTDYGFEGHPFRKDFPLIGEVEMRYDAATQRCVYEPVSIQPRVLVPRVIREDSRYEQTRDREES